MTTSAPHFAPTQFKAIEPALAPIGGRLLRAVPLRTLHLLDVENLAGGGRDAQAAAEALRVHERMVRIGDTDHLVVGCNPGLALTVGLAMPRGRLVIGRGPSGADRALLRACNPQFVAARFDQVLIASGDGIFAPLAKDLRSRSVRVLVLSRRGSLSQELGWNADQVLYLSDDVIPRSSAQQTRLCTGRAA